MSGAGRRYEFDEFVVDLADASLSKSGQPVHLEPRALQVLGCLLRHSGRLVSKEDLLESVWQGAFVTENSLARAVARARQALGDDAREPRYIETVHTLGYRFIGGLEAASEAAPEAGERHPKVEASRPASARRASSAALVGLALLASAVSIWLALRDPGAERAPAVERPGDFVSKVRLAVLPFKNLGSPSDRLVATGLTEELTNAFASFPELAVVSRQSADHYAGVSMLLSRIGAELSADFLLEGSVRRGESTSRNPVIRVTAQLIRVADDTHVWSGAYDRQLGGVLQTESWLTEQIVREVKIPGVELTAAPRSPTAPVQRDAYQAYLEGVSLIRSTHPTRDELARAVSLLSRAVELDPEYAAAWSYLSVAQAAIYWLYDPSERARERAYESAQQARSIAPDLPLTHAALGGYYFYGLRDYDRALEHLHLAQAGRPSDDFAAAAIGLIWRRLGRTEEALEQLQRSSSLNPLSSQILLWLGWTSASLRRYEAASEYLGRAISLAPQALPAYRSKVRNLWLATGDLEAARETLESLPTFEASTVADLWYRQYLYEGDPEAACDVLEGITTPRLGSYPTVLLRAECLRLEGRPSEAQSAYEAARLQLETAAHRMPGQSTIHARLGLAYAGLGRKDDAVSAGKQAVDLLPIDLDAVAGYQRIHDLAVIYARIGEVDAAVGELERLVTGPTGLVMSRPLLELDPRFDSLRGAPRFQQLLAD